MEQFVQWLLNYIQQGSYAGIFLGVTLSNISIPIPTELILSFAGYLVFQQKLIFSFVVVAAWLGELLGTTVMYLVGFYGGNGLVLKYSPYVFLSAHKLQKVQQWFDRYGSITVLLGRILPVIRGLIPLPAGFLQVNFKIYLLYIALSALVWTAALVLIGLVLGENWRSIHELGPVFGGLANGVILFGCLP